MSRILYAAAIAAMGCFSFAATTRADAPAAVNPPATATANGTTTANANVTASTSNAVHPWRASETIGMRVENAQGEHLGKIEDIVFNPDNGHIRYAVLSFGGFLGIGDKYFAVPWKNLRAETKTGNAGNEKFVLVLERRQNEVEERPGLRLEAMARFRQSGLRQFRR